MEPRTVIAMNEDLDQLRRLYTRSCEHQFLLLESNRSAEDALDAADEFMDALFRTPNRDITALQRDYDAKRAVHKAKRAEADVAMRGRDVDALTE